MAAFCEVIVSLEWKAESFPCRASTRDVDEVVGLCVMVSSIDRGRCDIGWIKLVGDGGFGTFVWTG